MKILIATLLLALPVTTFAQYTPLVDLPFVGSGNLTIDQYINALYILTISIAAFLAVFKIVSGGVKYTLSDVVTDKGDAKKDIKGAILGLLIVLSAVLILNTINTDLTKLNVLRQATIDVETGQGGEFKLSDPIVGEKGLGEKITSNITDENGNIIGQTITYDGGNDIFNQNAFENEEVERESAGENCQIMYNRGEPKMVCYESGENIIDCSATRWITGGAFFGYKCADWCTEVKGGTPLNGGRQCQLNE